MSTDRLARYIPVVQLFAARLVLFHQMVAERLGLTGTEFKCFRLLEQLGPMSVTALAREAGLQVGTSSGLVDRLEAAGFVRRERDAVDRRRLVLVACAEASARATGLYRLQGEGMSEVLEKYSDVEFDLLMAFMTDAGAVLARSLAASVRDDPKAIASSTTQTRLLADER